MGKRLIVAEKPSVGRDIANVLNCRENGEGCRIGDNDIVTWAVGHLVGLCYPDELDQKYADWKMDDLPIFPDPFQMKVLESSQKQFEIIKKWMNDAIVDSIVCATDAGREGELIFRYIYKMAGCKKPVDRLWISSLTFRAIKEGFENIKPDSDYDDLYESARCRSEADWLIGMNASRAYAVMNDMKRLSVGRVLSPTLAILVKRELERRNFVPVEYYEVIVSYKGFDGRLLNENAKDTKEWSRFPVENKDKLEQLVRKHSSEGKIISYELDEEKQASLLLYDLTSLQRDANRLFGMSSQWTLDTAQALYEKHKAITYPRTDSRFLSSDIKSTLAKRLENLQNGELEDYAAFALKSEKDLFGRYINNAGVSDHHAIIPTGEAKGMDKWTKQEKQIYDLICRRFIAMFYPDRHVFKQKLQVSVDGWIFVSSGEKVLDPGWSVVDTSNKNKTPELPDLSEGDQISVETMRLRKDTTKPPAPHTEASLLTAMEHAGKIITEDSQDDREEEYGIGTPATRAATIEKLIDKEMVVRQGRALNPTEYGIRLVSILPEVLQSPEMTGVWEAKLAQIGKGKYSPNTFMEDIKKLTADVIRFASEKGNTHIKDSMYIGNCPVCGNYVREYPDAYYCVNKECGFRPIFKARKGSHPTLKSIVMRNLLINGTADSEKGTYTLSTQEPYISFKYAPKPIPDYGKLRDLLCEYCINPVNKVPSGGGFWIAGAKHDELIKDFLRESNEIGCQFDYFQDSKALKHKSGWCHRVEEKYQESFMTAFNGESLRTIMEYSAPAETKSMTVEKIGTNTNKDPILSMVQDSGFEYADKRSNGGCLWIIAGEAEGKPLIDKCKQAGMKFAFSAKGGRASKHRPAWYSLS